MIFDGSLDHARAAGGRWVAREAERRDREGRTTAEIESPERVQLRLDRLTKHAMAQAAPRHENISQLLPSMVETIGLERVIGEPDFRGIAFLEMALAISRFVGRVVIRSSATVGAGFGTGFMVSPRLLMTNNHVLPSPGIARFSEVEFDFQYDRFRRLMPSVYFALEPQTFFMTDPDLDFTLVAVAERSRDRKALNPYGWSKLVPAQGKALLGDPLNIIQHPRGQAKQIVFRSNRLVDLFDQFAHYTTDTEPGSSGSPVYNDQWEIVALHHSGVPKRDEAGNLIAKDGSVWREVDDPSDLDWVANEGIRISSLVAHIESRDLGSNQAALRREMLELDPPAIELADLLPGGDGRRSGGSAVVIGGGDVEGVGTSVTLTVPVRLTLSFGEAQGEDRTGLESPAQPRPPAPPGGEMPLPPEAAIAFRELEDAATRPYYDAESDRRARDAYWRELLDNEPADWFAAISDLLERTHGPKPAYRPAVHVYPWVDLRPGSLPTVRSIYSNKGFDPRELIEADFRIEAERAQAAERLMSAPGGMPLEAAIDSLEASLPYNCEHVVPQSWFAKKEPMRGDLHHLFTCEMRCNSFRSNTPYYDFPDFEEAIRDDCGKSEHNKFEPSAGKGAVARATLYFLLRYPGQVDPSPSEYEEQRIATLLAWHLRHPPDEYEHHRNAAIQEKQGNRNPLIDFPEWSERIDFGRGLGGA